MVANSAPCDTYDALLPRRSGVRASGLFIALGEAILIDDHRVPAPYVDAGTFDLSSASLWGRLRKFVVDYFPVSILCRPVSIRGSTGNFGGPASARSCR